MTLKTSVGRVCELDIPHKSRFRIDINVGNIIVHALLYSVPDSEHVTVFTNGTVALSPEKSVTEIFQRHTWAEEIGTSCIFLSDPTLTVENELTLGWGQGSSHSYALAAMSLAVRQLRAVMNSDAISTTYVGSSGGGFQALVLASMDPQSSVMVNNPQTNWLNYGLKWAVRRILESSYSGMTANEVFDQYPERCSVVESFKLYKNVPRTKYLLNISSSDDVNIDFRHVIDNISSINGKWNKGIIETFMYNDQDAGHNPLGKRLFLEHLRTFSQSAGSK